MFKQVFIRSRKTWFYVPFERVDIVIKTQIIRDSVQPKQLAVHFASVGLTFILLQVVQSKSLLISQWRPLQISEKWKW